MAAKAFKTILIDDEIDAINLLKELLKDYPEIEIVAAVRDAREAYKAILKHEPDLIFLDIRMPRESGLELSEKIMALSSPPAIIFVTAYDQFAVSAIKQAALDYILKPVDREKLRETIARFKQKQQQEDFGKKIEHFFSQYLHPHKMKFNTRSGFIIINPADIIYCQAEGNYTEIFMINGEREVITTNLGKIEKDLPDSSFYRVSRSHIVNINYILRVDRKNRFCGIGINGTIYNLTLPAHKIRELEKKLANNL